MAHKSNLTYSAVMEKDDEIARRVAQEIESGSAFGERTMRSLGIHPDDTRRRKLRRRMFAVAAVGAIVVLILMWMA